MKLTAEQLKDAKNWIADCQWPDLDQDDIDELTQDEIIEGLEQNFSGGVVGFIKTYEIGT